MSGTDPRQGSGAFRKQTRPILVYQAEQDCLLHSCLGQGRMHKKPTDSTCKATEHFNANVYLTPGRCRCVFHRRPTWMGRPTSRLSESLKHLRVNVSLTSALAGVFHQDDQPGRGDQPEDQAAYGPQGGAGADFLSRVGDC